MKRDFLALSQFSKAELDAMFVLTKELKQKQKSGIEHHLLKGKSLAMIFEKSSTRTRISFEVGMYQLGGHPLFIASKDSQMGRGEPIKDSARVMARYCDGVMIRTYAQATVEEFAKYSSVPVINGLTDLHHPCQIMADIFTVIEHRGGYQGLKFAWIGDGNNMANTWIEAAAIFGFDLTLACPEGYDPENRHHPRPEGSRQGRRRPEHRRLGQHGAGRGAKDPREGLRRLPVERGATRPRQG